MQRDKLGRFIKGKSYSPTTQFKKGHSAWNKGKSNTWYNPKGLSIGHGWNRGKRTGKVLTCLTCKKEFYVLPKQIKVRKYCSHKCQPKNSINFNKNPMKGTNHWNWKGGLTPLREKIISTAKYIKWRKSILERDKYSCKLCGKSKIINRSTVLNIDHFPIYFASILIKYKIKSVEEAKNTNILWDINNARTLCIDCHKKTPNYFKPIDKYY